MNTLFTSPCRIAYVWIYSTVSGIFRRSADSSTWNPPQLGRECIFPLTCADISSMQRAEAKKALCAQCIQGELVLIYNIL